MSDRTARQNAFRADERGAVLTFGLFLAPFLVAAVYYVVATANVMMQREGLQAAADASVFAPAVVSARGMNAIAAINVLMMCIMSVVIPVRALLPAYMEVASMGCWGPCSCIRTADAARAATELSARSVMVEQRARDLLTALSDAQESIAERAPHQGVEAAKESARRTSAFLASGVSPDVYSSSLSKKGCRYGLPVEDDSFRAVCKRTKPYVNDVATRIAGQTLHTFGMCLSGPWALALAADDLSNPESGSMCREAASPPCSGSGPHPKKVSDGAVNGSDHMQFWSRVEGHSFDAPRSGVEVGGKTKGSAFDQALDVGIAQSEIYFDCSSGWASCNKNGDALWDTRWTARLRRVRAPELSFTNDHDVKEDLANADHWQEIRSKLYAERKDFTTGVRANTEAANTLVNSQDGPLQ
jgi:hypothetical protein